MIGLRSLGHRLRRADGTTSIEFAVVAIAFFMMLLGAIELGRAMWMRNSVQFVAEEVARWVLVRPNASQAQMDTELTARLAAVGPPGATGTAVFQTVGARRFVQVIATVPFQSITGLVPIGPIALQGRARLPVS